MELLCDYDSIYSLIGVAPWCRESVITKYFSYASHPYSWLIFCIQEIPLPSYFTKIHRNVFHTMR